MTTYNLGVYSSIGYKACPN